MSTLSLLGYENAIDYFTVSGSYSNYFRCRFVNGLKRIFSEVVINS